jgi:hypothetical protein
MGGEGLLHSGRVLKGTNLVLGCLTRSGFKSIFLVSHRLELKRMRTILKMSISTDLKKPNVKCYQTSLEEQKDGNWSMASFRIF